MKSPQDRDSLDYALEILDPALLDRLAANILPLTHTRLEVIQCEQTRIQPTGGDEDGI